jgi:hypothetical protein
MQIVLASGQRAKLDIIDYTPGSDIALECSNEIFETLKREKFQITRLVMKRLRGKWELITKDVHPDSVVLNFDKVHDCRPWQINDTFSNREVPNEDLEWDDGNETMVR